MGSCVRGREGQSPAYTEVVSLSRAGSEIRRWTSSPHQEPTRSRFGNGQLSRVLRRRLVRTLTGSVKMCHRAVGDRQALACRDRSSTRYLREDSVQQNQSLRPHKYRRYGLTSSECPAFALGNVWCIVSLSRPQRRSLRSSLDVRGRCHNAHKLTSSRRFRACALRCSAVHQRSSTLLGSAVTMA
jgi:hypothetical protein